MYEGEATAGPVPTLFAEDPVASKESLLSGSDRAHADYQRLVKVFFMPENVTMEEAIGIAKKPRYNEYSKL